MTTRGYRIASRALLAALMFTTLAFLACAYHSVNHLGPAGLEPAVLAVIAAVFTAGSSAWCWRANR